MRYGKASIVLWFTAALLAAPQFVSGAETNSTAAGSPPPEAMATENLPTPLTVTLRASRPVLSPPFAVTLRANRQVFPAPFAVMLRGHRTQLPDPLEVDLRAARPALPPPFAIDLQAGRQSLPAPMQVTLNASRTVLPDPFALQLNASRASLPAPYSVVLHALREAGRVAVPDVIGKPLDQAMGMVDVAGLQPSPELGDPAKERTQIPGTVYITVPEPGTMLEPGRPVTLKAYGERPKRVVPNTEFLDLETARDTIAKADFDVAGPALGPPAPAGVEPGLTSGTDPPAGSEREIFTPVTILVFGPHAEADFPREDDGTTPLVPSADNEPHTPPVTEPPVVLPPPQPDSGLEPSNTSFANIWLGKWQLTSTNPDILLENGALRPFRQILEIRQTGDKIVGNLIIEGAETFHPFAPGFAENWMTADVNGSEGGRIRLDLMQSAGRCSGTLHAVGDVRQGDRVLGTLDILWNTVCVKLAN